MTSPARSGHHGPSTGRPPTDQERPARVWSVDEHLEDVLGRIRPMDPIEVPILDAQGCVLAEDVTVAVALPPFDNSSMDGYAVRAADVAEADADRPVILEVVGDIAAGAGTLPHVGAGSCARIMTGAPLPPGADAVVPVEWTDGGTGEGPVDGMRAHSDDPAGSGGLVQVYRPAKPGAHVRTRGGDARAGELALALGTVLGPPQIGLLAAVGRPTVKVRPRPRVVVLSTGSELVQPGEEPGDGRINDSNSFALTAAARAAGAVAYRVGSVADDAETLRATVEDHLVRADLVVTSGGVSVGAYDVVKEALEGVEFRRLAMQPGKPQGFGLVGPDRVPLCALPGNPVSAYVSFEVFVRPVIRALMGLEPARRETVRAVVDADLASLPGKRQFLRARHTPPAPGECTGTVTPVGGHGSHLVKALAHADALIVVPEETTEVPAGTEVDVLLLG
ncbi:molybdopterin molybdotransferase MoeA [Streptomyces thermolineatus]|uniref:Molybdopterin molybdenumtransferase n=1 Tax=Streptomyces thermolineatus TaxID=44033 RepID=A0ABP5ZVD8_9ACTN